MTKKLKFRHIRSMRTLDDEILKLKLKKEIIEQEMLNNVDDLKISLSPRHLIGEALGFHGPHSDGSRFFTVLKSLALTFTAVRGSLGIFNRVKRIFIK